MFIFASIVAYVATMVGLQRAVPGFFRGILNNLAVSGMAVRYYTTLTWRFLWRFAIVWLPAYLGLVIGSSFLPSPYWMLGVLALGLIPAFLLMYALSLLRLPVAVAGEKLRTMGKWIYDHIPAMLFKPPSPAVVPAPAPVVAGFWRAIGQAITWPFRTIGQLVWFLIRAAVNGPYMAMALPLKGTGGAIWILGQLADSAQSLMRDFARVLAGWVMLHLFLVSLVLMDVYLRIAGIKVRLASPFLLLLIGFVIVLVATVGVFTTDRVAKRMARRAAAASAGTVAAGKGMPFVIVMLALPIVGILCMVAFMHYNPEMAQAKARQVLASYKGLLKSNWIKALWGAEPPFLYTRANTLIPQQFNPVVKDGEIEEYTPVIPATPITTGTRGVIFRPEDPVEASTGQAMVKIFWEDKTRPGSLLVSPKKMEKLAHWVPKEGFDIFTTLPGPLAPPATPPPTPSLAAGLRLTPPSTTPAVTLRVANSRSTEIFLYWRDEFGRERLWSHIPPGRAWRQNSYTIPGEWVIKDGGGNVLQTFPAPTSEKTIKI